MYLAITSTAGSTIANALAVVDLKCADWKPRKLVDGPGSLRGVVGNVGTKLFIETTQDAARLKVVAMDSAAAKPVITDVVPEQDSVLSSASLVGGRLLLSYLVDVKTEVRRYTLEGKANGVVAPGVGPRLAARHRSDHDQESAHHWKGRIP